MSLYLFGLLRGKTGVRKARHGNRRVRFRFFQKQKDADNKANSKANYNEANNETSKRT